MKSNYDYCVNRVLLSEGGYTNDHRDPGGATNFGITIADVREYIKPEATPDDVMAMTPAQARTIYRARYWDVVRGDELPSGVDYAVFDFGVNSGVSRAVKYLQRIVGVYADGVMGSATISAVGKADAAGVAATLCDQRLAFLKSLPTWSAFGNGWGRRVASVRAASVAMARPRPEPVEPRPDPAQPQPPKSGGLFSALRNFFIFNS